MTPVLLELRRSRAWSGALVIVVISVWSALVSLRTGIPLAGDATAGITTSTAYTTPLVAAFFAVSSSGRRANGLYIRAMGAARSGYTAYLPHLVALAVILLLACGTSVLVVGVALGGYHAYGIMIFSWLAVWAAALLLGGAIGYLIGLVPVPRIVSAPLAFAAVFGAWSLASTLHSGGHLTYGGLSLFPVMTNTTNAFVRYLHVTPAGQVEFFIGLTVLVVTLSAMIFSRRRGLLAAVATASFVLSTVGGAMVLASDGQVTTGYNARDYRCVESGFTVCVHPAYVDGLPQIVAAFTELRTRVAGTPLEFTRLEQNVQGIGERVSHGAKSLYIEDFSSGFASQSVARFVQKYGGSASCTSYEAGAVESVVDGWFTATPSWVSLSNAAEAPIAQAFEQQATERNIEWLLAHYAEYEACTLSFDDLENSLSPSVEDN